MYPVPGPHLPRPSPPPLQVAPQLLACMCGRGPGGASDESVAASTSARVNASAVLLELCKDLAAAHLLADQVGVCYGGLIHMFCCSCERAWRLRTCSRTRWVVVNTRRLGPLIACAGKAI